MYANLKSFNEGFIDGIKLGCKIIATGVVLTFGLSMCFSGVGFLFAGHAVPDALDAIWGKA